MSLHVKRPREVRHSVDPAVERKAAELEALGASHPCASCPDLGTHVRWATRADALAAQMQGVDRRIQIRTETLARQFDRVLAVLEALGYVDGWAITPKGRMLARIYGEGDLLVGESLVDRRSSTGSRRPRSRPCSSTVVYESRERVPLARRAAHGHHEGPVRAAGAHLPPDPAHRGGAPGGAQPVT